MLAFYRALLCGIFNLIKVFIFRQITDFVTSLKIFNH